MMFFQSKKLKGESYLITCPILFNLNGDEYLKFLNFRLKWEKYLSENSTYYL
jgi:hypothetical protein